MPGLVIPVIPKQTITLSSSSGAVSTIVVARSVSTVSFREGVLVVRLHALSGSLGSTATSDNTASVDVYPEAPSVEDPTRDFVGGTALATVSISQADFSSAPSGDVGRMKHDGFGTEFPAQVRVVVTQRGGASPPTITFSADIVLKD